MYVNKDTVRSLQSVVLLFGHQNVLANQDFEFVVLFSACRRHPF